MTVERFEARLETVAESVLILGEQMDIRFSAVEERIAAVEERIDRTTLETQAIIRQLTGRVQAVEQRGPTA